MGRDRVVRRVGAGVLLLAVLVWLAVPAWADEPGESDQASVLVRQAIALTVETPDDTMQIQDKVEDALKVDDKEGVNTALVEQASSALAAGDLHQTRNLLERSIGARPHLSGGDVPAIRETSTLGSGGLATGEQTGTNVVTDPLAPRRAMGGGQWAALAASVLLWLLGGWLALRYRPLRRKEA